MAKSKRTGTKVITGKVRASYAHVFEPQVNDEGRETYGIVLLVPKEDTATIKNIEDAIAEATKAGQDKFGKKFPKDPRHTFYDGDEERPDDEAYQGHMYLNCSSNKKPGVIKKAPKGSAVNSIELTSEDEFYSGCYCQASVNMFPYEADGGKNRGISAGINNLLFVADGERLAGGASAESDFEDELDSDDYEDAMEEGGLLD